MAKVAMKQIEIAAVLEDSQQIMDLLQRRGIVQIKDCREIDGLNKLNVSQSVSQFDRFLETAKAAKELLLKYSSEEKKSMLAGFAPRRQITAAEFIEKSNEADVLLNKCYEINDLGKRISEDKANAVRNETLAENIAPWIKLDIPMNFTGTEFSQEFIGYFPFSINKDELMIKLAEEVPEADDIEIEIVYSDDTQTCAVVFCLKENGEKVERALRSQGFVKPTDVSPHLPKEQYEIYLAEKDRLLDDIKACEQKLSQLSEYIPKIDFLIDYFSVRSEKYDAIGKLGVSDRVFILDGYIPAKYGDKLKNEIEEKFTAAVSVSDTEPEDENEPVLLKNNSFAAPVEPITEMYSLPSKKDIDPNGIMAFFYYVFFGMMFSDAGYGLLMVIATAFVILKYKPERQKKNTMLMYMYCGISTMFWGIMYGSFFGDIINVIRTNFLGLDSIRLYLWKDPQGNDLMSVMVYCFLFGLIHLFVGVAIKGYMLWRDEDKFGAFCETVPIFLAVGGAGPICAGMLVTIPDSVTNVCKYLAVVGVVLIILTGGRSSKSIGGKIGGGLYAFYNVVSGYLSDILSYSRLLALGLVTGIIGNVINMMGTLPESKITKAVLLIVVFAIGHTINFGINIIGAYVHTNRLQYVEFFSRFYEGGGKKFRPFKANTKTLRFKEEITNG